MGEFAPISTTNVSPTLDYILLTRGQEFSPSVEIWQKVMRVKLLHSVRRLIGSLWVIKVITITKCSTTDVLCVLFRYNGTRNI